MEDIYEEIYNYFYNGGDGLELGLDSTPPTINLDYPINYSFIDGIFYPFYINGTASDDTAVINVLQNNSLWGNNIGTNTSWSFLNTSAIPEGNYTINITAFDAESNQASFFANFTVDITSPTLTRNFPFIRIRISALNNPLVSSVNGRVTKTSSLLSRTSLRSMVISSK